MALSSASTGDTKTRGPQRRGQRRGQRGGQRRARLSRPERERQMLAAAHRLFAARGYAAVTMEDVAASAGITKPLLYHYFGNKERLYLACMAPAGDALVETIVAAVASTADASAALDAGLRAFFAFLAADRAAWRVLFDETLPDGGEVARRVAEQRERLSALVEEALLEQLPVEGRSRAKLEVQALSSAVLGAAEALGRWWLRSDAIPAEAAAQMLIDALGPGLRERVAGHPAAPASERGSADASRGRSDATVPGRRAA